MRGSKYVHLVAMVIMNDVIHNTYQGRQVVSRCPESRSEWQQRIHHFPCPRNIDYHCMVMQNGSLVEFCMRTRYINKGTCPETSAGSYINNIFDCGKKQRGCPWSFIGEKYLSNTLYKFPACYRQAPATTSQSGLHKTSTAIQESTTDCSSVPSTYRTEEATESTSESTTFYSFTSRIKDSDIETSKNAAKLEKSDQLYIWIFGAGIVCGILFISTLLLFVQRIIQWKKQRRLCINERIAEQQQDNGARRDGDGVRRDGDGEEDSYTDIGIPLPCDSPCSQTRTKVFDTYYRDRDTTNHIIVQRSHSYIEFSLDNTTIKGADDKKCDPWSMYQKLNEKEKNEMNTQEEASFYTSLNVTETPRQKPHKARSSSI